PVRQHALEGGAAFNPRTEPEDVAGVASGADLVLCMSINPGYSGQAFMPEALARISRLRAALPEQVPIQVDGGIDEGNVRAVHDAGASLIVAGSAIFQPEDVEVLECEARSTRRAVGIVVSRADVAVTNRLLESALAELDRAGVGRDHVLVMAVPGAFELPIGAMALAKTRRYACIVALGSASDSAFVAGEAASGLQLAGLETGV